MSIIDHLENARVFSPYIHRHWFDDDSWLDYDDHPRRADRPRRTDRPHRTDRPRYAVSLLESLIDQLKELERFGGSPKLKVLRDQRSFKAIVIKELNEDACQLKERLPDLYLFQPSPYFKVKWVYRHRRGLYGDNLLDPIGIDSPACYRRKFDAINLLGYWHHHPMYSDPKKPYIFKGYELFYDSLDCGHIHNHHLRTLVRSREIDDIRIGPYHAVLIELFIYSVNCGELKTHCLITDEPDALLDFLTSSRS